MGGGEEKREPEPGDKGWEGSGFHKGTTSYFPAKTGLGGANILEITNEDCPSDKQAENSLWG